MFELSINLSCKEIDSRSHNHNGFRSMKHGDGNSLPSHVPEAFHCDVPAVFPGRGLGGDGVGTLDRQAQRDVVSLLVTCLERTMADTSVLQERKRPGQKESRSSDLLIIKPKALFRSSSYPAYVASSTFLEHGNEAGSAKETA
ncbi:hypothetical protein Bca4012_027384 [Brassica carinata]|uniref:Uncharacterized protein n=1 Tax=Brassica carinata TaxID=52824 RepID=A0A8X7VKB5_BRACI|nr:hypothetical protein Bca52824_024378 [Brassica carinata]